jgi:hypothetical protein
MNRNDILTLPDNPSFDEFLHIRALILNRANPPRDFSETNLYAALPLVYPELAPLRTSSALPKSGHRCHIAESFLFALGLDQGARRRCGISRGVRESLGVLFGMAKRVGARVAIPSDVYPTYWSLAESAGISETAVAWSARDGDIDAAKNADWILVCDPIKPWGSKCSEKLALELANWAEESEGRLLIADLAYDNHCESQFLKLARRGQACVLASLSKGWLSPWVCGICIWPSGAPAGLRDDFAKLHKDERLLREAFHCLDNLRERPREVFSACMSLAADAIKAIPGEFSNGSNFDGYFMVCDRSWKNALAYDFLTLPASTFGSVKPGCVFSCLPSLSQRDKIGNWTTA